VSMVRTLLGRQLWHLRWILSALMLGLVGFEMLVIHLAQAFDAGPGIDQLLGMLPQLLQDLVNSQIATTTFPAFVAFGFMHPAAMVGCFAVLLMLATTPPGDRDSGLLDLLLARPLPRRTYLAASVAGVVLASLVLPCCILLGCALGLATVEVEGQQPWTDYVPACAQLSGLLLAFGGLGLAIATTARRRGTAIARSVSLILLCYAIDTLSRFSTLLGPLIWATPFAYFDPIRAALEPDFPWIGQLTLWGVFGLSTLLSFRRFETRDL